MKTKSNSPYRVINFIFLVVLACIMLYSALFNPEKGNYPIPSSASVISSHAVPSTGLSRSFSCIVRLRFHDAKKYNPYGMRIFMFFFVQLLLRIGIFIFLSHIPKVPIVPLVDAAISILLFLYCFYPFIKAFYSGVIK